MKKKNHILLYIMISLLLIVIVLIGVMLFLRNNQLLDNDNRVYEAQDDFSQDDYLEDTNKEVVYSKDELFSKLTGVWKYVDTNGTNYVIRVFANEAGEERFSSGVYGVDYRILGVLSDVQYKDDNIYQLTVLSVGCHGDECLEERDDATYYINVDISQIDGNQIVVDGNTTYEYVAKTLEEAESSFWSS